MADKGWVKIHRAIEDSGIWQHKEPFDKRSAWIDLIMMANRQDREIIVANAPLIVHRGQRFTSYTKLQQRWHWSRNKLQRYIELLKNAGMIVTSSTHNGTLITIVNYGIYQGDKYDKQYDDGTTSSTPAVRGRSTNKKSKNVRIKEEKKMDGGEAAEVSDLSPAGVPWQ